ncbi:hypothetical protein Ltuc_1952 [Legionella tucsonensis]|uniref:Uncharacterized protein n=1 Tax=Legionella tucsonensis TaxID=40335 RepID=A0A0W0ZYQ0_9GAMM|nr:hypothetical protein Ltuc_1952 [Legionella tucsonensis]
MEESCLSFCIEYYLNLEAGPGASIDEEFSSSFTIVLTDLFNSDSASLFWGTDQFIFLKKRLEAGGYLIVLGREEAANRLNNIIYKILFQ